MALAACRMVPPVIRDGDMLVDGGYLNNMPVDVMHSLGVHTVLVVRPLKTGLLTVLVTPTMPAF